MIGFDCWLYFIDSVQLLAKLGEKKLCKSFLLTSFSYSFCQKVPCPPSQAMQKRYKWSSEHGKVMKREVRIMRNASDIWEQQLAFKTLAYWPPLLNRIFAQNRTIVLFNSITNMQFLVFSQVFTKHGICQLTTTKDGTKKCKKNVLLWLF